jgi:hypothetical protein
MPALSVHRPRALAFAAAGVLALVLSGCSGSSNPSNASAAHTGTGTGSAATGSPAAASSSGASAFTDSGAVISALKSAGQKCTPESDAGSTALSAPGLRSVSACSLGTADGGTVTATVFDDHTDAQAYADLLTTAQDSGLLIGSTSARAVLGQNWVVVVDGAAPASRLGAVLGGTVLGGPTSSG